MNLDRRIDRVIRMAIRAIRVIRVMIYRVIGGVINLDGELVSSDFEEIRTDCDHIHFHYPTYIYTYTYNIT